MEEERKERTVLIIKPHLYNNLDLRQTVVRTIIDDLSKAGLRIVARKECVPSAEMVQKHYASSEEELLALGTRNKANKEAKGIVVTETPIELAKRIVGYNIQALTSGPVLAMLIEGPDAISKVRALMGPTEPDGAKISAPDSWRAIFCSGSYEQAAYKPLENGLHGSDSKKSSAREQGIWFPNLTI